MKSKKIKVFVLSIFLFVLPSCTGQVETQKKSPTWKSKFYPFSAEFDSIWTKLPSHDTKEKILFGVIDKTDGKSYIVKITDDLAQSQLSDSSYFEITKDLMLQENQKNILLNEKDTVIHEKKFHCMTFILHTTKWGVLKQSGYIYRDGIKMISIQMGFPLNEKQPNETNVPKSLIALDKGIKIDGK